MHMPRKEAYHRRDETYSDIADLDFKLIDKRKQLMDSRGHYSRPELLSLLARQHYERLRSGAVS